MRRGERERERGGKRREREGERKGDSWRMKMIEREKVIQLKEFNASLINNYSTRVIPLHTYIYTRTRGHTHQLVTSIRIPII